MQDSAIGRHRSQCRIVADILLILHRVNPKITYIVHEANLPYGRLIEHLNKMERSGLVTRTDKDDRYEITEKGKRFE